MTGTRTDVALRPYSDADEDAVLALLDAALGGGPAGTRPAAFFRWKHLENPFGRSYLLVAELDDRIVGLRAFMRWRFVAGDMSIRAVRAVDTATHPDVQGRGIFSALTRRALEDLREEADLIFNTPNDQSLPGYLKMGWRVVGRVPVRVRVRRPVRFLRHARSWRDDAPADARGWTTQAAGAGRALADPRAGALLERAQVGDGLATPRSLGFLSWRYADAPLLDYRAVGVGSSGGLRALAIFRVRPRGALIEATVAELLCRTGDDGAARRALGRVARASGADHVTCAFPPGSTALDAARGAGFLPAPGGPTLVANPLRRRLEPDPTSLASWSLTAGDLEVF